MSNKRNQRRPSQRVRAEISRDPVRVTKSQDAFMAALPLERARKEQERYWKRPTKAERQEREKRVRRWRLGKLGNNPPRADRKPRTKYGNTYWNHNHDV